ncbi:MAG: hypothetical protein KatS3mg031_2040 [Chitinophagales bacterium]|nr:MAG: hypothetical protein KatS3mg031_2040 [Chitinophagales bacterium]
MVLQRELLLGWGFVFIAAFLDCFTLYVVKWRANAVGKLDLESIQQVKEYITVFAAHPLVWVAVLTFCMGPMFGYVALTRLELTAAYPVSITLHIIFTFLFGIALLNEPLTPNKCLGLLVMAAGLYFFFKQ